MFVLRIISFFVFLQTSHARREVYGRDFNENNHPSGRFGSSSTHTDTSMFIFGGRRTNAFWGDLWEFDTMLLKWRSYFRKDDEGYVSLDLNGNFANEDFSPDNWPPSRAFSIMTYFGTSLYLFSGKSYVFNPVDGAVQPIASCDSWEFSLTKKQWRWLNTARSIIFEYDDFGETKYLPVQQVGGMESSFEPPNVFPKGRSGSAGVIYDGNMIIFGGLTFEHATGTGDMWKYIILENKWEYLHSHPDGEVQKGENYAVFGQLTEFNSENRPGSLYFHSMATFRDSLWVFGGRAFFEEDYYIDPDKSFPADSNALWEYRFDLNQWRLLSGCRYEECASEYREAAAAVDEFSIQKYPSSRRGAGLVYSQALDRLIMVGGMLELEPDEMIREYYADWWEWDTSPSSGSGEGGGWRWRSDINEVKVGGDAIYDTLPAAKSYGAIQIISEVVYYFGGVVEEEKNEHECYADIFTCPVSNDMEVGGGDHGREWTFVGVAGQKVTNGDCVYGCGAGYWSSSSGENCCKNDLPLECEACFGSASLCTSCSGFRFANSAKDRCVSGAAILVPVLLIVLLLCGIGVVIVGVVFILLVIRKRRNGGDQKRRLITLQTSLLNESELKDFKTIKELLDFDKELTIDSGHLNNPTIIAKSQNSTVYKCDYKGVLVVLKSIPVFDTDEYRMKTIQREFSLVSSCKHQHIVQFHGFVVSKTIVGLVFEFCKLGSLKTFLKIQREKGEAVNISMKIRFLYEIALAVKYLHSQNVLHRDLKLSNCLLTEHNVCKITDFGLACEVFVDRAMTKGVGTSMFVSPEVVLGEKYGFKADSYSFAILAYILITENFEPFPMKSTEYGMMFKVAQNPNMRPDIKEISEEHERLRELITENWDQEEETRWDFDRIRKVLKSL